MCGLAGVAGDVTNKDIDVFKELLVCSALRGTDATGIAAYSLKYNEADIYKYATDAASFVSHRKADRLMIPSSDVLIGHTRRAAGVAWNSKFNHDDAHPFWYGDTIGAHNGVIGEQAIAGLQHHVKGAIDSENLIYSISKVGIENTLSKIWGAYALSILDIEKKTLSFVRNKERPLSYAFSKDKKRLYWASEAPMLYWILQRNGIETFTQFPQNLEEHRLLSFDLLAKVPIADAWTLSSVKEGKEPEKKSYPSVRGTGWGTGTGTTFGTKKETPEQILVKSIKTLENQLADFDYSKRKTWGPKKAKRHAGLVRSLERLYTNWANLGNVPEPVVTEELTSPVSLNVLIKQKIIHDGCAMCCTSDVDDKDVPSCVLGSEGEVLCPKCASDETLRTIIRAPLPRLTYQPEASSHDHH